MGRGFQCYDDYKICLENKKSKDQIEGIVSPAELFHRLLCNDEAFRVDYKRHRDCFKHIQQVIQPIF